MPASELHLQTSDVLLGKPNQRHIVRTTVSCTQATTRKHQCTACTHARNEKLKFRKTRARLEGDDKTQRRAKAHAHPASASPSLVFPQPRPAAAAAHRRRHEFDWHTTHGEHRRKCGGRTRQPRSPLTRCLGEMPTALACRRRAALSRGARHLHSASQQFHLVFSFQSFQLSIQQSFRLSIFLVSHCHVLL